MTAVHNGERLFLIGPRRFGKTSLLQIVQAKLEDEGCIVLKCDAEKHESVEMLARELMAGALHGLTGPVERVGGAVGKQISRFFGALKPQVEYDLTEQKLSVAFGVRRNRAAKSDVPLLTDVLDGIDRMSGDMKKTVAIVIDEFQQLVSTGGLTAERQLRAVVQTHRHLSYIFAGSKTRLLIDMISQHSRPFYRMGSALFLGAVPRGPFSQFLQTGFESGGFRVAEGAIRRILDIAEDVPYSVQRLAHRCWDLLNAGGVDVPDYLTSTFVERTAERIALEDDPTYTRAWVALTPIQKRALKAVVATGGRNLLSKAVILDQHITPATMQKALRALDAKDLIREEQSLGSVRYRLDDPFLAVWLRLAQSA